MNINATLENAYTIDISSNNQKQERDLNFELLRIVSTILIIISHFSIYGGSFVALPLGINSALGQFMYIFGPYGVTCFVLISGYYLVNSKFKAKNILKIILQVLFYSIVFYVIARCFNLVDGNVFDLFKNILPISHSQYWFITTYIGLYVFFPFINSLINVMTQKRHKHLIILNVLLLSFISTFISDVNPYYSDLMSFIYFYLIGAYIRKYDVTIKDNKKLLLVMGISIIFTFTISELYSIIGLSRNTAINICGRHSIPMLCLSISTLLLFKNIKIKKSKVIAFLAKASLGVYLIHANQYIVRFIFDKIIVIKNYYLASIGNILLCVITCTFIIYAVCVIIDTVRRKLLEEPLFKLKVFDKVFTKIDNFMNEE